MLALKNKQLAEDGKKFSSIKNLRLISELWKD